MLQLILFIVDSRCTKHMTGNLKLLCNFVEKYLAPFVLEKINLLQLLVMEIWFKKISRSTRLSHLNFDYINLLSKKDIVIGLPKLKYVKDQLCSSCELSKAKRSSFKTKVVPSSKGRLNLLHMDLCGPMRIESINGNKYILVIVDDYSIYTWTLFLRSNDETPVLKDFLKMIQRNLQAQAEAIATACYTQNRSIIIPAHEKTTYHIINDRKPSIRHLHIFGYTCYLTRDGENLDKMKEKRDPCILIKEMSKTFVDNNTSVLILKRQKALDYDNSGLAPQLQNVSPYADTIALSQQELDLLFGPLYDEFFTAEPTTLTTNVMPRKTTIIKQQIYSSNKMNLSILSVH
ncbi:integrase, catalytic region, zinc finger, CCHC-type containing protein [Tanacetum coccineum]